MRVGGVHGNGFGGDEVGSGGVLCGGIAKVWVALRWRTEKSEPETGGECVNFGGYGRW